MTSDVGTSTVAAQYRPVWPNSSGPEANNSSANVMYGTVYQIPEAIGRFDVGTLGSILLHLRDPFLAMQQGPNCTRMGRGY